MCLAGDLFIPLLHPSLSQSVQQDLPAGTTLTFYPIGVFCHWSCDLQRFSSPEHTLTPTPRCIRGVISTPSCLCYGLIYHNSSFYQTHFFHYSLGHYHIVLWLQDKQRRTVSCAHSVSEWDFIPLNTPIEYLLKALQLDMFWSLKAFVQIIAMEEIINHVYDSTICSPINRLNLNNVTFGLLILSTKSCHSVCPLTAHRWCWCYVSEMSKKRSATQWVKISTIWCKLYSNAATMLRNHTLLIIYCFSLQPQNQCHVYHKMLNVISQALKENWKVFLCRHQVTRNHEICLL